MDDAHVLLIDWTVLVWPNLVFCFVMADFGRTRNRISASFTKITNI